MDCPVRFGAFAMTVRPPPVTAPAMTACLSSSLRLGMREARKVISALSLKAVRTAESGMSMA